MGRKPGTTPDRPTIEEHSYRQGKTWLTTQEKQVEAEMLMLLNKLEKR